MTPTPGEYLLSNQSLDEMRADLKTWYEGVDPITLKPTKVIIPAPVRRWQQAVLDMVNKASK